MSIVVNRLLEFGVNTFYSGKFAMRTNRVIILLLLSILLTGCHAAGKEDINRRPAVAGKFYPDDPVALKLAVNRYLENAEPINSQKPFAIVVPHAGFIFSGQIAADAFAQTKNYKYNLIVLLGTNHTIAGFSGVSIFPRGTFETPLGKVRIDETAANRLLSSDQSFSSETMVHEREHSIEVQLPFVQTLFPTAKILPIVVGEPDSRMCEHLGQALANLSKQYDLLIVASSDLSHYPDYETANSVDRETVKAIATINPGRLKTACTQSELDRFHNLETCACGEAPILTAMYAALSVGIPGSRVISYANSGDCSVGDRNRVVGYGAIVLGQGSKIDTSWFKCHDDQLTASSNTQLTEVEKRWLLNHARKSIEWYLSSSTTPLNRSSSAALNINEGAFVTLKKKGELCGCIGHMSEDQPLMNTVGQMALAAAFEDRRFDPVTSDELSSIEVEISVLTPIKPIASTDAIVIGRDGVVIRKDGRSAVFLPQVATEQNWSRTELLDNLCLKAGLPRDAWKSKAEFLTFQAVVFSEHELK